MVMAGGASCRVIAKFLGMERCGAECADHEADQGVMMWGQLSDDTSSVGYLRYEDHSPRHTFVIS